MNAATASAPSPTAVAVARDLAMKPRSPRAIPQVRERAYSHSMVPGGLLVTSSTTRLTSATSPVIRVEILASRS